MTVFFFNVNDLQIGSRMGVASHSERERTRTGFKKIFYFGLGFGIGFFSVGSGMGHE